MENYYLNEDVKVFGVEVKTFPFGIGEAFDALIEKLPGGVERSYYGISYVNGQHIIYLAVTKEEFAGEAEKYAYDHFTIARGKYNAITLTNWSKRTEKIKDMFHEMLKDECPVVHRPCVEWYKSDQEMMCMVRAKQ
jgi:hypothetical protein